MTMLFTAKRLLVSALLVLAAASGNLADYTASTPISAATANPETIKTEKQADKPLPMNHSGGMMSHDSMNLGVADAEYDLRFIDGMTPHHQGAIAMAQNVLKNSQRPELRKLANEIIVAQEIVAQEKEIAQMGEWRKAWHGK